MSRINFSLTQLEYAVAVQRTGSFAKAAEECFVTQPTLSMQIQKLEEALGCPLFDRSKKPLMLTPEGEQLLEAMKSTLGEARKISDILQEIKTGDLSGELKVGIIPTVAPYLLPRIIKDLNVELPKMRFSFFELQTAQIVERLRSDQLDVGIAAIPIDGVQLVTDVLYTEAFFVLAHKDHPLARVDIISPRALSTKDLWLLEEGHCLRGQVLEVCRHNQQKSQSALLAEGGRNFEFEGGSLDTLAELVRTWGGYTLIPELAVEHFTHRSVVVRPLKEPAPSRQVGLIYARKQYKRRALERFQSLIQNNLPKNFGDLIRKKVIPVHL
jgi:LysR family hydrogen peroxide-inducible transcriptional activator